MAVDGRAGRGGPAVAVLGMHRSGTSLIAGVLHHLGVHLGPQVALIEAKSQNPRGFFEHRDLTKLSEEVLRRLGGSWDRPPAAPPEWERLPDLADLRHRARELIETDLVREGPWGWKDPRLSFTLPFFRDFMPSVRCVISIRNPVDVAASLELRDRFPFEKGVGLWVEYAAAAVRHTVGLPTIVVSYEEVLDRWPHEVARLSRFLGFPDVHANPRVTRAIEEFIDAELRHHRASLEDVLDHARLASPAKDLYVALSRSAKRDSGFEEDVEQLSAEAERAQRKVVGPLRRLWVRSVDWKRHVRPRLGRVVGKLLQRW